MYENLSADDYRIEAEVCERNAQAAAWQGRKVEAARLSKLAQEHREKAMMLEAAHAMEVQ